MCNLRLTILGLCALSSAYANTIHVPSDYSTIQAGLNATQNGDTVLVAPGTYHENILWPNTQSIKLMSEAGAAQTFIDADEAGSGIQFPENITTIDTTTVIDGFTIMDGVAPIESGWWAWSYGGGIDLRGDASPWIRNNQIEDCKVFMAEGGGGGGIAMGYSGGSTSSARIEGNFIENCLTIDGIELFGAGVYIGNSNGIQLIDNVFTGNECQISPGGISYGGGIFVRSGDITISGNTFLGNEAFYGAALYLGWNEVNADISDCLIEENVGVYPNSSCVYLGDGYYSISKCTVSENGADLSGIRLSGDGFVSIDSCTISDNALDGIRRAGGNACVTVHHCNIYSNGNYGIFNEETTWISAPYCWWGNPSGPGGVGPGTGDEVSEYVYYEPWLGQLCTESSEPGADLQSSIFPNPFSLSASVSFTLTTPGPIRLDVFDISGRLVETLADGELAAGEHSVVFDGSGLAAGVYLVRLTTPGSCSTARCVCVR